MSTSGATALVQVVLDGKTYPVGAAVDIPVRSERAAELARYGVIELVVDREVASGDPAPSKRRRSRSTAS